MYGATATAEYGATAVGELDRANVPLSERERCERLDQFLTAVSSGWPQVMSFLESSELDPEARQLLRKLQGNGCWDD
jgi:hypothetical protein